MLLKKGDETGSLLPKEIIVSNSFHINGPVPTLLSENVSYGNTLMLMIERNL